MAKKLPPELLERQFKNMYVCMRCNAKNRTTLAKVNAKSAKCRKCGSKRLRLKAKERRGSKA